MNWYYRMLLSYAPIFFVVISSVIILLFALLNGASESRYMETNRTIVEQMMRTTDASLRLIERNVVSELETDRELQNYFSDEPKTVYDYYLIQKNIVDLQSLFPFVNSIYLYKTDDPRVVSDSGAYQLDAFADRPFLASLYEREPAPGWTGTRLYAQSVFDHNPKKVVSLVKFYPYASVSQGVIVVNLYADSIVDFLNGFDEGRSGSLGLTDGLERMFRDTGEAPSASALFARSSYTGWRYYAESVGAEQFSVLLFLSNVWVIAVMAVVAIALAGFTFVTHRHYKPIQGIIGKIGGYMSRKGGELGFKPARNEFDFIETAFDHLLRKSSDYDHLYREDGLLKQQRLFYELLAGHRRLDRREWERRTKELGLPHAFGRLGVVALEIDRYAAFTRSYKPGDQHLLKFVIESAFRELAQQRGLFVWMAWMEPSQLAVAVHLPGPEPDSERETDPAGSGAMRELCEEFRTWIGRHLELTVSAGIGETADSIEGTAEACRSARERVSRKAAFGSSAVIDASMLPPEGMRTGAERYMYIEAVRELAHSFRIDDAVWRERLERALAELREAVAATEDVASFVRHLSGQLDRELGAMPPEIRRLWEERHRPRFDELGEEAETVEELEERLPDLMLALEEELDSHRAGRKHHEVAVRVKRYLDEHYADPELSLLQVSDRFGLPSTALSHLFKDELGEKFIDYVLKLRLGHAKRLLIESDEPIQSIAEKVGYTHVISFHRAFKKWYDLPPGEYRNLNRPL